MRAALYVRVSTLEQALEGFSVGVQKEKLDKYASAQEYPIVGVYSDEGFSGKSLVRPAVEKLIQDIKQNKIDIVLIYKLDRLSRHVKDVLELVELFEKYKVTLYSLNENLDLSSPFGRAALKMSETFSELERETIVERMTMGKTARAKSGMYACPGKAPFGYTYNREKAALEINPQEAEIVIELFDKYISGEYSFRKLFTYINEKYSEKPFPDPMSLKHIIRRSLYSGYYTYKGELIKAVNVKPIIAYETYLKALEQIKKNTSVRRHDSTPYLLTGMIVCGACGRTYVGKLFKASKLKKDGTLGKEYQHTSYGCTARLKYDSKQHGAKPCTNDIFPSEMLEKIVEDEISNLQFDEFISPQTSTGLIDKLILENSECKKQKERLLDLYLNDTIDKDLYLSKIDTIEKQISKNNTVLESEQDLISASPTVSIDYLKQRQKEYPTADKKQKKQLVRLLIKQIAIDGQNITINWHVKAKKIG